MNVISRADAKIANQLWYYTGVACKNGHTDRRYTNTGICYKCKRAQNAKDFKKNKTRVLNTCKRSYIKNREKRLITNQRWAENNRKKSNEIKLKWRAKNIDNVRKRACELQARKRKDPFFRISRNISKALWAFMHGQKAYQHWEKILGYTKQQIIAHIESLFDKNMSWDNYGTYWHVDHKVPLNYFGSQDLPLDEKITKAWSLNNLQPLEASANMSKSDNLMYL